MHPPRATLTYSYIESSAEAVPVAVAAANHCNKNAILTISVHISANWGFSHCANYDSIKRHA